MSERVDLWRSKAQQRQSLFNRAVPAKDFRKIAEAMIEDGLDFCIEDTVVWRYGPYVVSAVEVRRVWGLHHSAYRRFVDWALQHNPWAVE